MTQTNVYSVSGEVSGTIEVPEVFSSEYRPDIIKRAILAAAANKRQPYGPNKRAGMRHSVSTWGKGRGTSRVQRIKAGKKATESPNNVSGRRAHPPRPERIWDLKVNKNELRMARYSAIAATGCADCVRERGHDFDDSVSFPIVIEDEFENLASTSEINDIFDSIGIGYDIERAKEGRKIRAGRGKMRNRRYRTPVSILIVVSEREAPVFMGAKNLPGVEVETIDSLSASILAPGGDAGRLTVYTRSAIAKMGAWKQ
ncbi:MAG: 50S ribosomal protein L4 [Methanomassiliicoccaceae archaeon]|jgi:large subunit ribosomal protein L4e|nr:50S ribosomal protein L4 [Methanomassiliicoccaceae archaeon]